MVPELKAGRRAIHNQDAFELFEILHAVRDNLNLDLRESALEYFKELPSDYLLSHYPATYPAPDGEYRIPATHGTGEPDVRRAALARAAALSMVAFDPNAPA